MSTPKTIAALTAVIAALCISIGGVASKGSDTKDRQQLRSMLERMDYIVDRCQYARQAAVSVAEPKLECDAIIQTSDAVMEIAAQVRLAIRQTQNLVASDGLVGDAQFQSDIRGLSTQLERLIGSLENLLQYLEHMTYRLDLRTSQS
jgi:hypothetical protein